MSRTIEQIQASIISDVQSYPELAEANTPSRRGIWRLITFVQASAILLLEQIIDVFKAENEIKINSAIPATTSWITNKVFNFQYSATNPQVIQLVDLVPVYPITDSSLRIITRCSVVTTISGQVIIKVAKSNPPVSLSNTELSSLQSYVNIIGVPGIKYTCFSSDADRVYLDVDIYYDGQYSTVISGTIENTINTFLSKLPFNGQLKVSDLEFAIRNTTGVNDVLFKNLKVRANSTSFSSGTFLIQNNTVISRLFPTIAGYVVLEDSVSNNFNFIAN